MKQEQYPLEKIEFGTALIRILKTRDGIYGMHGQRGWDDLPYWEYWDAWIITTQAYGNIDYGPFKSRKNAKKEHSGTLKIDFLEAEILRSEKEAEDKALEIALNLEEKGFRPEIEFGAEKEPRILGRNYFLEESLPDFILRQISPKLKDLYLKENLGVKK